MIFTSVELIEQKLFCSKNMNQHIWQLPVGLGKQGRRHHLYTSNLTKKEAIATTTMYILLHSLKKILSFYTVGAT